MTAKSIKQNLTVRIDPEMRQKLETIAEHEVRTLANQIYVFLRQGIDRYLEDNHLKFRDGGYTGMNYSELVPEDFTEDIPF